jgi:hypothetical protein
MGRTYRKSSDESFDRKKVKKIHTAKQKYKNYTMQNPKDARDDSEIEYHKVGER